MIGQIQVDRPILVVDDTNSTRYSTVRVLRAAGVEVLEATNGQQALQMAPGCGAIVLDVNLPDIDGFEVCRLLRAGAVNARVPVIHLSAQRLRDEDKIRGLESGADAYLTHPAEPGVLVATINALLRARAAEQAELRSRARFEAVFRTAPVGIALVSASGEPRESNAEMHRILGIESGADADTALRSRLADVLVQCRGVGTARHASTMVTDVRANRVVYLDCRVTDLDDDTRLLVVVDATTKHLLEVERERLLQSERSARHSAEEASRAKDSFLALLSHELRNPLAPISSAAKLLQMAPGDSSVVERASGVIVRQVRHMKELVDDLMDVSRVTRGLVELERTPVELRPVLDAAVEQVRPLIESRAHAFTLVAPTAPVVVDGDRTRLVQVVANLLNNAAKYTPTGGSIRLELSFDANEAIVRVRDDGLGIAPELLPHIFELFTQAERTPDRAQGGLGVGLALVRSVVQLHGGRVQAASAGEGHGSTFTVALPTTSAVAVAPPERMLAGRSFDAHAVLLVDDNTDAASTLAEVLRLAGHAVRVANDAQVALDLVRSGDARFDVFVLDIGLPGMTGYELAGRLHDDPRTHGAVFIALTGYGQQADQDQSREAGFDRHLVKPVRELDLLDAIASLTAARAAG
ncbi:hybrid sensor histidine kinase/response regulator [Lysobacter xanthus]